MNRGLIAALLLLGCGHAYVPAQQGFTLRAGPEERERAACLRAEYPPSLDERALARARMEDLVAARRGEWSTFAATRLLEAREDFSRRCQEQIQAER